MVSRQAARWVPENKTVLTNVLETIEMYCGVEDTNRHGGHRERASAASTRATGETDTNAKATKPQKRCAPRAERHGKGNAYHRAQAPCVCVCV